MRLLTLLAGGASLLGLAAAMPDAYPDSFDLYKRAEQTYTIKSGDTLGAIAQRFNRGLCQIADRNNISHVDFILAGAAITIPDSVPNPDSTSCLEAPPSLTCINGGPGFRIVQQGDSFGLFSYEYGVTLAALRAANQNNVKDINVIQIGQIINIPICANSEATVTGYVIKPGDTFYKLGKKFGSSDGAIKSVNPGINPNQLQIGQAITLISSARPFPA